VKKKCPGETTNGGTYHPIGQERSGFPVPIGQDMKVAERRGGALSGRGIADNTRPARIVRKPPRPNDACEDSVGDISTDGS
jgi:hypothetical protein